MNCTICNSQNLQLVKEYSKSITSDSKFISNNVVNMICSDCGNIFNSSGSRNDMLNFYQNLYDLHGSSFFTETQIYEKNNISSISDWHLKQLISLDILPNSGKILDIGCGKGNFLKQFHSAFSNWNLFGIESSKNSLKLAKQNLINSKFFEGFYKKNIFQTKFDLIVAFNVLEHVENPRQFLDDIFYDLDDGAIVCFNVPNFKINPADLLIYDHLSHFTIETLKNLLSLTGFESIKIIENENKVPLLLICKKISKKTIFINHFSKMKKLSFDLINYNDELFSIYKKVNQKYDEFGVIGLGPHIRFAIQNKIIDSSKIFCFYDENPTKIGTSLLNIPIKSLNSISQNSSLPLIFSLSPCYIEEVSNKIRRFNINQYIPKSYLFYKKYF